MTVHIRIQGEPALIGTLYRAGGKMVRSAAALLDADSAARVRQLARYLTDGTVTSDLKVMTPEPPAPLSTQVDDVVPRARAPIIPMLVAGAGAAAVAAGGVVYLASADYDVTAPRAYHDGKSPAVGIMLGGSAVLGGGAYLWLRSRDSASAVTATLLGVGFASLTAGAALYASDEDPGPSQSERIRDTAAAGVVVGAAGLAAGGLGLWLWHRGSEPRSARRAGSHGAGPATWAPSFEIWPSRGVVSCAGAF